MQILFLLASAALIQAAAVIENKNEEEKKRGKIIIKYDGYHCVYYDIEILKTDFDRPYLLLATDYSTNTVYFSYRHKEEDDLFKTAYVNLNTKEYADLQGISNGFAQTVDQKNHVLYIGGNDGLYKYNHKTKTGEHIGAEDHNICYIYFKDILYYSTCYDQFLYTFINGESSRFMDLENTKVDQFVIDNEDIMFFTNSHRLFGLKKGTKDAVIYKQSTGEGIHALTTDINGNVYVCTTNHIFKVDKTTVTLEMVVATGGVFGLAFDNENNIVFSDSTNLVRFNPNKSKTCKICTQS